MEWLDRGALSPRPKPVSIKSRLEVDDNPPARDSKAKTGREKDRLFLATYREVLDDILPDDDSSTRF